MRASIQCDITLDDVRLPARAMLPNAKGLRGPFSCLNEARYGIIWGAMGAARDSYEQALDYSQERMQFGKPLAGYQLTQEKLVNMATGDPARARCWPCTLGRLKDAGVLAAAPDLRGQAQQLSARRSRSAAMPAPSWAATASPWTIRRCATPTTWNRVRTYEGTDEVHTLILGNHITGIPAFR